MSKTVFPGILGANVLKEMFNGEWTAWRDGLEVGSSELHINPHSIDVTLGGLFIAPSVVGEAPCEKTVDPYEQFGVDWPVVPCESSKHGPRVRLPPKGFMLGFVRERFLTIAPRNGVYYTQKYDGRSTVGRLGVATHVTAAYGDLGFSSNFTLEIVNHSHLPIWLYPGMRIGQITFEPVDCGDEEPVFYSGSYSHQDNGPRPPQLGRNKF